MTVRLAEGRAPWMVAACRIGRYLPYWPLVLLRLVLS